MKKEQTQCSETLAFKPQMPRNDPEKSIQHLNESLNKEFQRDVWEEKGPCGYEVL
jgi:hypothetical protein